MASVYIFVFDCSIIYQVYKNITTGLVQKWEEKKTKKTPFTALVAWSKYVLKNKLITNMVWTIRDCMHIYYLERKVGNSGKNHHKYVQNIPWFFFLDNS